MDNLPAEAGVAGGIAEGKPAAEPLNFDAITLMPGDTLQLQHLLKEPVIRA
jgi:hypothetical protein